MTCIVFLFGSFFTVFLKPLYLSAVLEWLLKTTYWRSTLDANRRKWSHLLITSVENCLAVVQKRPDFPRPLVVAPARALTCAPFRVKILSPTLYIPLDEKLSVNVKLSEWWHPLKLWLHYDFGSSFCSLLNFIDRLRVTKVCKKATLFRIKIIQKLSWKVFNSGSH